MEYLELIRDSKILIINFNGSGSKLGKFELYNFLTTNFNNIDSCFYQDMTMTWYHKGIKKISSNIEETVQYLKKLIKKYEKVIFMGISAGGYASILFGSLCKVKYVISIIPQVILKNPINKKYKNLRNIINPTTKYLLYGNSSIINRRDLHSIKFCHYLKNLKNVYIFEEKNLVVEDLVYNGKLYKIIKNLIKN